MRRLTNKAFLTTIGLALILTGSAVLGQQDEGAVQAPEAPGPNRGVARISVISGDVSVRLGDANEFVAAAVNAPLVASDTLVTGEGSRAEVQFDYSNMIRLGPLSEVNMAELDYRRYQVQIGRGTVLFRVLRDRDAEVELSTPSVSIRPVKSGTYRVSVLGDGSTEIVVRAGEVEIFTPRGSERLRAGHALLARGNPTDPEFMDVAARPSDEFDYWSDRRDQDLQHSRAYQYVSTDVYGADDLHRYGQWENAPEYGAVWSPANVPADWAPYRDGRWVWVDYYGWSWVSYDPWGWAPYHYGRWFCRANRWYWYPGGRYERHYWSPALVAFFGYGGGGVGVGFGRIGWVPLAPREALHPWWGPRYYGGYRGGFERNVTIVNVNVANTYRNARYNGVSGVDSAAFGRGRVNSYRVGEADLRSAGSFRGGVPVAPTHDSLRWSDHQVAAPHGGLVTERQKFYSSRPVPRVDRVPFEQQRQSIEQANSRQFGRPGVASPQQPAISHTDIPNNTGGWRRFGDPAQTRGPVEQGGVTQPRVQPSAIRGQSGAESGNRGWRRYPDSQVSQPAPTPAAPSVERNSFNRGPQPQRSYEPPTAPQPQVQQPSPSYNRGSYSRSEGPARQAAPPAPTVDRSSFGRSEAPRMQTAPIVRERHESAPAVRQEAPRNNGGGGGRSESRSESRSSNDKRSR